MTQTICIQPFNSYHLSYHLSYHSTNTIGFYIFSNNQSFNLCYHLHHPSNINFLITCSQCFRDSSRSPTHNHRPQTICLVSNNAKKTLTKFHLQNIRLYCSIFSSLDYHSRNHNKIRSSLNASSPSLQYFHKQKLEFQT